MIKHTFTTKSTTKKRRIQKILGLPWLRALPPAAKKKAIRNEFKKLAVKGQLPKGVEGAQRRAKARPPRSPRRHSSADHAGSHIPYVFKNVYGANTTIMSSGYPGAGVTTTTSSIASAQVSYLTSWSSVNGVKDIKHPHPHRFGYSVDGYYIGSSYNLDRWGNGNRTSAVNITGGAVPVVDRDFDVSTYNNALGQLYDQIRGTLDLSIDLAESHQAKSMIAKTARGMTNLALTFRKMRRSNPRDWGNLWLEFTYGWRPLAQSIYGTAHKLLLEPMGPLSMTAIGKSKTRQRSRSTSGTGSCGGGTRVTLQTDDEYRCRIVAQFKFQQSAIDSFAGFSSLNPVSIAWELTPYSFVVDWFVDLSGYLRNFETAMLYRTNFKQGYISEGWKSTVYGVRSYYCSQSGSVSYESSSGLSWKVGFRRSILGSIPFPRAPRFDPKLGTSRLTSAAALLGQLLPGHERGDFRGKPGLNASKHLKRFDDKIQVLLSDLKYLTRPSKSRPSKP